MPAFKLTIDELTALFEPDNICSGASIEAVRNWGKLQGLEGLLHTDYRKGISKDIKDHDARIQSYGDNKPFVEPTKTFLRWVIQNFYGHFRIFFVVGVIILIFGIQNKGLSEGWMEGGSILISVMIMIIVFGGFNYILEQKLVKIDSELFAKDVQVYRGGDLIKISVYQLLVGDIVKIQTGQILQVDGILIEGSDILVEEQSLTGEDNIIKKSVPVSYQKEEASPFIISSSKMMSGAGLMVVCAVGQYLQQENLDQDQTQQEDPHFSPIRIKLQAFGLQLIKNKTMPIIFISLFISYIKECDIEDQFVKNFFSVKTIHQAFEYFIVTFVFIAVTQGFVLPVCISHLYSFERMKEENILAQNLYACEIIGGADNICSDKTGTLTKNIKTVTRIFVEQRIHDTIVKEIMSDSSCRLLSLCICNNSNADPKFYSENGQLRVQHSGNKTQCALLEAAYRMGFDYKKFRNSGNIKKFFPFTSERKKMATVYEDDNGKLYLFLKGAPDFIIPACTSFVNREAGISKINEDFVHQLNETFVIFAGSSLTTLLLTYKEITTIPESWDQIEKDLTILAMFGMKDPLRDGICDAVRQCNQGGVTVRMVTGDSKLTAISIAKQAGILQPDWVQTDGDYAVMEGKQFREFVGELVTQEGQQQVSETVGNLQNFTLVRNQLKVLARSSPDDKYLMCIGLKQLDHVVALTGDGTNDAPALREADISFAMGISGTQVAKESSDIILLDDSFCLIVTAIKWGRNIQDSIRKYLQFKFTVSFVACILAFVRLNPLQMVWAYFIVDILASLALTTEPPSDQLLKRKPYSKNEELITNQMLRYIISQSAIQIIILGTIHFRGPEMFGIPSSIKVSDWNGQTGKHHTIFFNVLVMLQVFNVICARKLKPELNVFEHFFRNKHFFAIIVSIIIIQLTIVEYGGKLFKTVKLSYKENLLCLVLGSVSLLSCLIQQVVLPNHLIICRKGVEFGSFKFYWTKVKERRRKD